MRKLIVLGMAGLTGAAVVPFLGGSPASAHGWVTAPAGWQDMCATGLVQGCGALAYEPQSVEAPKGSTKCSGGTPQFTVLDDANRFPATSVLPDLDVTWKLIAMHRTAGWRYHVNGTLVKTFSFGGAQPPSTVTRSLSGLPGGRSTILAVWNIADTIIAFYSCIDVQVGAGGSTPKPTPKPKPTPTATPKPTPTAMATPSPHPRSRSPRRRGAPASANGSATRSPTQVAPTPAARPTPRRSTGSPRRSSPCGCRSDAGLIRRMS